jgi:hypothetical protein
MAPAWHEEAGPLTSPAAARLCPRTSWRHRRTAYCSSQTLQRRAPDTRVTALRRFPARAAAFSSAVERVPPSPGPSTARLPAPPRATPACPSLPTPPPPPQVQTSCAPLVKKNILAYQRDPSVPGTNVIDFPEVVDWDGKAYIGNIVYRNFSTRMAVGENVADAGYVVHKLGSYKVRGPDRWLGRTATAWPGPCLPPIPGPR